MPLGTGGRVGIEVTEQCTLYRTKAWTALPTVPERFETKTALFNWLPNTSGIQ